jgi:hypothetical protein
VFHPSLPLAAILLLAVGIAPALASTIQVDEMLFQYNRPDPASNVADPSALGATVDMIWQDDELVVTLRNTSGDTLSKGTMNLLTGLGFALPAGVHVSGGSVSMQGSTAVNFTATADNDVSTEHAYENSVTGGHFLTVAQLSVNTVLSVLKADAGTQFSVGSLDPGVDHGGIDFGLLMLPPPGRSTSDFIGSNPEAIQDTVQYKLTLSGPVPENLVDLIDAGPVVLAFGSPNTSSIPVPEPTALALLATGALGLLYPWRRRR